MRGTAASVTLSAVALASSVVAHPTGAELPLQPGPSLNGDEKAEAVKDAFQFAWDGYMEHAFPNDELHPLTNGSGNSRNGWGASAVDALSTAIIMKLPNVVNDILDHIDTIDYSKTDTQVSLFETTIRYLGGMISAYDLLSGPLSDMAPDQGKVKRLLEQSIALADVMKFAFDTDSGVPNNDINIEDKTTEGSTNSIAAAGTLVLEWTRLSDLTGETEYGKLAQVGESKLLEPEPPENEPFPGLIGGTVNVKTGLLEDDEVSWGGSHDSFYEYLIKMYVYDPKRFGEYKERWITAVESSMEHLQSSPESHPELVYLASYKGGEYNYKSEHLACFNGGNFILGGQTLDRRDLVNFGLKLVEGCYQTYHSTASKIGPEGFGWAESDVPKDQENFYEKNGFYISNKYYNLRPEVIESYYYAYRATGDTKYRDYVWEAFDAINTVTRTKSGFTSINDVTKADGGKKDDNQESFLFAEVMKYAYLAHAPDGDWQLAPDGKNKFVYNTEAHPVRVFEG